MKQFVIRTMMILALLAAGGVGTVVVSAQTEQTQQIDPKEAAKQEKARKKQEEKERKAKEKAEREAAKQRAKIEKIKAQQAKDAAKNEQTQQQQTTGGNTWGPEWGENATAAQRGENVRLFNFYSDAYNNKEYDKALGYMRQLIANCPKARVNIYAWGTNIYRQKINSLKDTAERNAIIDSLMVLYDKRMAAFGDDEKYGRSYILKIKARDYYQYRADDKMGMLKLFKEAIDADTEVDPTFINQYFTVLTEEYQENNIETDYFMNEYDKLASLMAKSTDEDAKTSFDALLIRSGAADCTNLEKIFSGRLAEDPDNKEQLAKAFNLLARNKCYTAFFFTVGDKYFAVEPSTSTAIILSKAYEEQKNYDNAMKYLRVAMERETNPVDKANLCVQISGTELAAGRAREAAEFAQQAIQYNPTNGYAYMCLAQAYASGSSICAQFEKQTVFWLAYDTMARARSLFEGNAEQQRTVDSLMRTYREFFPSQSDCFFRGMTAQGEGYNVSCGWISGHTTIRYR